MGPHNVAAFVAEPVVRSTNGAVPAISGYFKAIREICDRHGVLLILDDVMSGMGRIGSLFSHQKDGIIPDIVAIGKGLAAGYQPISGYVLAPHIYATLRNGSSILQNGQTHVNHPFACAIALEVQKTIAEENLIEAVNRQGDRLRNGLKKIANKNPFVGDVRGRGLFLGIEFVADKETKKPIPQGSALAAAIKDDCLTGRRYSYNDIDRRYFWLALFIPFCRSVWCFINADFVHTIERFTRHN